MNQHLINEQFYQAFSQFNQDKMLESLKVLAQVNYSENLALRYLSQHNKDVLVEFLLSNPQLPQNASLDHYTGHVVLLNFITNHNLSYVKTLVEKHNIIEQDMLISRHHNVFHECVMSDDLDIFNYLSQVCIEKQYSLPQNTYGDAFAIACEHNKKQFTEYLLEHSLVDSSDVNLQSERGLRGSIKNQHFDMALLLINMGGNIHFEDDEFFKSAILARNYTSLKFLLMLAQEKEPEYLDKYREMLLERNYVEGLNLFSKIELNNKLQKNLPHINEVNREESYTAKKHKI